MRPANLALRPRRDSSGYKNLLSRGCGLGSVSPLMSRVEGPANATFRRAGWAVSKVLDIPIWVGWMTWNGAQARTSPTRSVYLLIPSAVVCIVESFQFEFLSQWDLPRIYLCLQGLPHYHWL